MVLVSKSPPQDFVLGVGAKLGREQKSTCKFSTGTHHTHPGFEAARRIDKQSPRIQKVFGLRFCKIKQNIRKENSKLHRTEVSRNRAEVSRVQRWKFQEFAFKETFHHAQTNSGHNKLKPNVCRARTLDYAHIYTPYIYGAYHIYIYTYYHKI